MRKLSHDPLYGPLLRLGDAPKTGPVQLPRSTTPVDARSLGYGDPAAAANLHVARREGDPTDANRHRKPPAEVPHQEQR